MSTRLKKGNIRVSLSVNKNIYDKYREFCDKEGLLISRQVEKFMKKHAQSKKDRNVLEHLLGK